MFPCFPPFLLLHSCQTVLTEARRYSKIHARLHFEQATFIAVGEPNVHFSWPLIFLVASRVPSANQLLNLVNVGISILLSNTSLDGRAKHMTLL